MTQDELDDLVFNLQRKMQLQEVYIFQSDHFKLVNDEVVMSVNIGINDYEHSIYVPPFVSILVLTDSSWLGARPQNHMLKSIRINGKGLKLAQSNGLRVQTMYIDNIKTIAPQMLQCIEVLDKLIISGDAYSIGSYAFNVGQQCSVDIRKCDNAIIDPRFLSIHTYNPNYDRRKTNLMGLSGKDRDLAEARIGRSAKIICTPKQYKKLQQDKLFRYRQKLVAQR